MITIRFAQPSDKEKVLSLITELMNNYFQLLGKPLISPEELPQDIFDILLKKDDVKIFIAEDNHEVVAMATLYVIPILRRLQPRAELEEFVVTKKERGKGIGKKLFETILQYCKDNNIYTLKLGSSTELTDAHAFYEKRGGKITEKRFRFDIE